MRRSDFHFDLPGELIAQYPSKLRGDSRLLSLNGQSGELRDHMFSDLPQLLQPGDLLVFNDTKVIPARLHGMKETGGRIEVLIERILGSHQVLAQIRSSKTPRQGARLHFQNDHVAKVMERHGEFFILEFDNSHPVLEILEAIGRIPLPPYIEREDKDQDRDRYQTVYATKHGAVAAPTAGLHFTEDMLQQLEQQGIQMASITLHVGAGTFQPVRVDNIDEHRMHKEWIDVPQRVVEKIQSAKLAGHRVIAVGTTSVRSLETAALNGAIRAYQGDTDIFITPGFEFQVVDAMITNFHLPESTLLMLVSAFAGLEHVLKAYHHAIDKQYRFFSYGDAMFITKKSNAV